MLNSEKYIGHYFERRKALNWKGKFMIVFVSIPIFFFKFPFMKTELMRGSGTLRFPQKSPYYNNPTLKPTNI